MKDYLRVVEMFESIQGEGSTAGVPAVFLRLAGCNLTCKNLPCDTGHIWRRQGINMTFDSIIMLWKKKGWLKKMKEGAHLVITGGEPLLQQTALSYFVSALRHKVAVYIELETNGTIAPLPYLFRQLDLVTCSLKFNMGDPLKKTINKEVIQLLTAYMKIVFKFVVRGKEDMQFIQGLDLLNPLDRPIGKERIYLMPAGRTAEEIQKASLFVVNQCKRYGYTYSPRLQISIWGRKDGV